MAKKPDTKLRQIVWPLAIAETFLWAGIYYLFPALIGIWEQEFQWSKAELAGALTLALLISAFLAPVAGRQIDRGRGRPLFLISALSGAVLLTALSQVTELWQFYAVWGCLGVTMAGCLYEPCFAVLTRTLGDRARQGITVVTLVAGLAGTVAFPTVHGLAPILGWRGVVLVFAALAAFVAVPLIAYALSKADPDVLGPGPASVLEPAAVNTGKALDPSQYRAFGFLAVSFAMMAFNHGALISHLLPLLSERGITGDTAILAASMIGPMQVAGRLGVLAVQKHLSAAPIAGFALLAMALASAALYGAHAAPGLLVAFVLFQGAGNGVMSVTRPVIVAEILGRRQFGVVAGMLATPYLGFFALAPAGAGLVWIWGGYDTVLAITFTSGLIGAMALMFAVKYKQKTPRAG